MKSERVCEHYGSSNALHYFICLLHVEKFIPFMNCIIYFIFLSCICMYYILSESKSKKLSVLFFLSRWLRENVFGGEGAGGL